jgi:hypothetical protein
MSLSLERCADPIQSSEVPIQPNGAKNNAKKWERMMLPPVARDLRIDEFSN